MFFNSGGSLLNWFVLNDLNEFNVLVVTQTGPLTFTLELEDVMVTGPAVLNVPDLQSVFFSSEGGLCSGQHVFSISPP